MHAAQNDDVGIGFGGIERQAERIADDVGNANENFRHLVVVGENYGVALALERIDRGDVWSVDRPFDLRDDGGDAFEQGVAGEHALHSKERDLG